MFDISLTRVNITPSSRAAKGKAKLEEFKTKLQEAESEMPRWVWGLPLVDEVEPRDLGGQRPAFGCCGTAPGPFVQAPLDARSQLGPAWVACQIFKFSQSSNIAPLQTREKWNLAEGVFRRSTGTPYPTKSK